MTKTVFDNAMVAHVWAQQTQLHGRSNNGNMSFDGRTLYSYSTPIAYYGEHAILVTTRRYSQTTSCKHMPAISRALDHSEHNGLPVFYVPNVGARLIGGNEHAQNLAALSAQYDRELKLVRRRDNWRDETQLGDWLAELNGTAARYASIFGLDYQPRAVTADTAAAMAHRAKLAAKYDTPAALAAREREAQRREDRKAEQARLAALEGAERLQAWREGKPVSLPYGMTRDEQGGAMLRVRGNMLETSQGASVPLADAISIYRAVKRLRSGNGADVVWQRNGETLPVGHFQVDRIFANGSFRAGCHLINWPEIEAAAIAAGVQ